MSNTREGSSTEREITGRVRLRPACLEDLEQISSLNEAALPAVNSVSPEFFVGWIQATAEEAEPDSFFLVADWVSEAGGELSAMQVLGFVLALPPGCVYESVNYRWFRERYSRFLYVDRIVVDDSQRGLGLGQRLYDAVADEARRLDLERVCCEVNVKPPNEGSLRFHARYGFCEVGRQATEGGSKEVSLQVLALN